MEDFLRIESNSTEKPRNLYVDVFCGPYVFVARGFFDMPDKQPHDSGIALDSCSAGAIVSPTMNTFPSIILILVVPLPAQDRAQPLPVSSTPAPAAVGKVLVLENERTLEGDIERI